MSFDATEDVSPGHREAQVNSRLFQDVKQPMTSLMTQQPFQPFFTLIEDSKTGDYHHPDVFYIFEDDDPGEVVSATLSALESSHPAARSSASQTDERTILIDMAADGRRVENAVSLSAQWQISKAQVTVAPSWADAADDAHRGLMLTLSGRESDPVAKDAALTKNPIQQNLDGLLKTFEQRLDELHTILGKTRPASDD